jgi:ubiquinone/menaquinone biosynthesis C-methylase UbiE
MTEDYNRRTVEYAHIHATSRIHFDIFFDILGLKEGQRLLDVGGGYGEILLEYMKRNQGGQVFYDLLEPSALQLEKGRTRISADISEAFMHQNVQFFQNDFLDFQSENLLDHVLLKMVFHEFSWNNKVAVLKKAKSLLKAGGHLTVWRPYLRGSVRDFFSTVIKKKDELAGFGTMQRTRYFCSEEEFEALLLEAGITPAEPIFLLEYIYDTTRRFESELKGDQHLYQQWISHILDAYKSADDLVRQQVKVVESPGGLFINFQRAIFRF